MVACSKDNSSGANSAVNAPTKPVETLPAGETNVVKETIEKGKGDPVQSGDTVLVSYIGRLKDGKKFDSNMTDDYKSIDGKEPYSVIVGAGQVIKGWDEGLVGLLPGSITKLKVPWMKGYGSDGNPPDIPGKADLFFTVKIEAVYKRGVQPTAEVTEMKVGSGTPVGPNSVVTFRYVGKTLSGHIFDDQTKKDIVQPISRLMPGFGDALMDMKPGGQRKIAWPPGAGNPTGYIPPNQPVVYEVTLIAVKNP